MNWSRKLFVGIAALTVGFNGAPPLTAAEPCQSGLKPGQRPGPYTAVMTTGPNRGTLYCAVCDTADRPAVIIFARSLNEPLGKLAQKLDAALTAHQKAELRSWITFLSADQLSLDLQVVRWSQQHALRNLPLGVFEDVEGPPSYLLHEDADVTILFSVQQKVTANFAFRKGELNDQAIDKVMQQLPKIVARDP
ncbi:MAG: hypothetical protein ACK4RK_12670 [Gemmataceae bacterium]